MPDKPVNVAVIGHGYWGPNLLRVFAGARGCNLVACCDLDESRLKMAKEAHREITVTSDLQSVLDDPRIDAISIATPISTHFALAKRALLAGKHVLVEKPLTQKSADAAELIRLGKKQDRIVMVGHTYEYSPPVNKIKELIQKGELGDLYYIDSVRLNLGLFQSDFNVLWDLAPHDISIILFLMEKRVVSVSAQGQSSIPGHLEDLAYLTIRFENGTMAHCHVSWLSPCKIRRFTIVGKQKMILWDDLEPEDKVKVYDKGISISYKQLSKLQVLYRTGDMYCPKIEGMEPLKMECQHFIDCIAGHKVPKTSGEVGLRVVKILEAAEKSLKLHGKEVRISDDKG